MIRISNYVFLDLLDGITVTPKLDHAAKKRYHVFGQDQYTVVIQRKELVQVSSDNSAALASWPAGETPIPLESPSAVHI